MAVKVNVDECIGCGACEGTCPVEAIKIEDVAVVDEDTCIECGACTAGCPVDALEL